MSGQRRGGGGRCVSVAGAGKNEPLQRHGRSEREREKDGEK